MTFGLDAELPLAALAPVMDQLGLGNQHQSLVTAVAFALGARYTLPAGSALLTFRPLRSGQELRLDSDLELVPDLPDDIAYRICQAIDAAKGRIPWDSEQPVTLADLCDGNDAAPLGAPLHPGAERYYRERGALK